MRFKPFDDFLSIWGMTKDFTTSNPKSKDSFFFGSTFLFTARTVDVFTQIISKRYAKATIVHRRDIVFAV